MIEIFPCATPHATPAQKINLENVEILHRAHQWEQRTFLESWYSLPCLATTTFLTCLLFPTGNGYFIYIESSDTDSRPGDKARLRSPPLNGTQCMTFYYNFYGKTMSCVVIYMQTADGSEKIVWIKSGHWGDRWIKTQIEMSEEKADYSVSLSFDFS